MPLFAGQARSVREFTPSGSSPQPLSQGLTAASVHTHGLRHPSSGLSLRHVPHGPPEPCSGKEPWLLTVITGLINHPYWLPSLSHFHTAPLPSPIAFPYSPQYKLLTFKSFSWGLLLGETNRHHLQCPSQCHLLFVVSSDPLVSTPGADLSVTLLYSQSPEYLPLQYSS